MVDAKVISTLEFIFSSISPTLLNNIGGDFLLSFMIGVWDWLLSQ
jgi:hypothetical protein